MLLLGSLHQFDNAGNAGRTADKDNLVNVGWPCRSSSHEAPFRRAPKCYGIVPGTQLLDTRTCKGGVEVDTLVKGVDLDSRVQLVAEESVRLARSRRRRSLPLRVAAVSQGTARGFDDKVLLELVLELLEEMVNKAVVEVTSTKVEVTSGGFAYEDTLLSG